MGAVRGHSPRWRDERGQAVPLVAIVVAIALLVTLGMAELATSVGDAGRARAAADAAALAGVEGGHQRAAALAAANGAELVAWTSRPDGSGVTVVVTVRVGRARATAAASNRGPPG